MQSDRSSVVGSVERGRRLGVVGLFAGVGGLELGLAGAGHETRLLCEFDAGARAVLERRFAGVRLHRDVRDLAPKQIPEGTDVLVAGFPCQDLSQAGRTAGIGGARSSLVDQVFRLLRVRRVPWVLLENVPFMLHLERGRAMHHLVEELERLGYRWAYRVVDAMAFGVPQRRRRVFVLASQQEDPAGVLFADDAGPPEEPEWTGEEPVGFYWTEGNRGVGWVVNGVPTLKGGSGLGIPSPPAVLMPSQRVVLPCLRGAERLQGFPADWTKPAATVVGDRFRWRLVGNAVCVPAARWLGDRLASPGSFEPDRLGGEIGVGPWPNAACGGARSRRAITISEGPKRLKVKPLQSFLVGAKDLSARATAGFVQRADRAQTLGKLRFPPSFLKSLRTHLQRLTREGSEGRAAILAAAARA
ncbi:MAG: DNA (cytosine-5-)-methyltransferase [Planctomycetes bacterium]|nr:DNA (cytosine-5-)-methyltransferase [Planctomycetota bacterium]